MLHCGCVAGEEDGRLADDCLGKSYSPSPSQLLNSTIERSSSPTGLSNILQQHHASLDPVHLCMMMTKLLRLAPRKRDHPPSHTPIPSSAHTQPCQHNPATAEPSPSTPTQTEAIHTLAVDIASAAVESLHRLTPRHCSTLLSGLSQCSPSQLHPPAWLVESLTTRAVQRAASASVHDLVQLLHAVTSLRARPTLPQLTVILIQLLQHAQLQRQEQVPRVGPQDVSMTLWSLATLQQHPGPIWMDAFLLCAAPQLPDFRPQALANSMWAVATLSHQPPEPWMEAALAAAQHQLPSYPPQELSSLLWALATLRFVPQPDFLEAAWHRLDVCCASLNAQDASNALWACSQFGHRPAPSVLAALAAHATAQVHSYSPQALCNVLEAFRRLRVSPPGQMLHAALTAAATGPAVLAGRDVASLLSSIAGTRSPPSHGAPQGGSATQAGSGVTALSAGDARLLQKLMTGCCARPAGDFSAHELVLVGQAAARLRPVLQPDGRWTRWWLVSTLPKMRSCRGRQLARLCETAASLDAAPPAAWLAACMAALAHRMGELQPSDLVTLCGALKALSQTPALAQGGRLDSTGSGQREGQRQTQLQPAREVSRLALPDGLMPQLRRQIAGHASGFSVGELSGAVRSMALVESIARATALPRQHLQRWRPSGVSPAAVVVRSKAVKRKAWRQMRKTRHSAKPGGVTGRLDPGSPRLTLRYLGKLGAEQHQQHGGAPGGVAGRQRSEPHRRGLEGPSPRGMITSRIAAAAASRPSPATPSAPTSPPRRAVMLPGGAGAVRSMQHPSRDRQQQHTSLSSAALDATIGMRGHTGSGGRRGSSSSSSSSSGSREAADEELQQELTVWYGIACLLSLRSSSSRQKLGQLCSLRGHEAAKQLPVARAQGRLAAPSERRVGGALGLGA
ncbi:MAG: hypothetical protein WDW36_000788 [Sanguina aurantia]